MSKITFRADDDLVERLEACDASKSEVMRDALRTYLDDAGGGNEAAVGPDGDRSDDGIDAALAARVDTLVADRVDAALDARLGTGSGPPRSGPPERSNTYGRGGELTVNVTIDGARTDDGDASVTRETDAKRETDADDDPAARKTRTGSAVQTQEDACGGCGESVPESHVYCPNCGEKQSHRAFCECGDEVRTDWAFCPGCGRRTPAADVLKDR
ncbi:double zinc ribbon domain-containing protein [Halorubrum sp. DTA98]|uniref:double zinc ribbon domain-containing protein n=1 Tax=Halorubrum sp. DTA98 TaxID=3402163 RepID=UPI003AAF39ED